MKDSDWLAGFAAGEGCFLISQTVSHRRKKAPTAYRFLFSILLRDDDAAVLYYLQTQFGGSVRAKTSPSHIKSGSKPGTQWEVAGREDVLGLIAYFDAHPLHAKKKRDYEIWREAAILYYHNSTRGGPGNRNPQWLIDAMECYRTQLKLARKYNSEERDTFVLPERGRQPSLLEI